MIVIIITLPASLSSLFLFPLPFGRLSFPHLFVSLLLSLFLPSMSLNAPIPQQSHTTRKCYDLNTFAWAVQSLVSLQIVVCIVSCIKVKVKSNAKHGRQKIVSRKGKKGGNDCMCRVHWRVSQERTRVSTDDPSSSFSNTHTKETIIVGSCSVWISVEASKQIMVTTYSNLIAPKNILREKRMLCFFHL